MNALLLVAERWHFECNIREFISCTTMTQNEIFVVAVSSWKKCEKVDVVGAVRESCYVNLHKLLCASKAD